MCLPTRSLVSCPRTSCRPKARASSISWCGHATSAQTGDVIDAEARIIFDINEPIDTPPIFNTLDAGLPSSTVDVLPAQAAASTFDVSWSGMDDSGGSGLADFSIYVSEDGGAFEVWLENTILTSASYVGEPGRRYAFYSVARDNASNVESVPPIPDAVTTTPGAVGIIVTPTAGLTTTEAGGTAEFMVVLAPANVRCHD